MNETRMVVCITGAASGIGLGIANSFAENGYDLVLVDRTSDRLYELRDELVERFAEISVKCVVADLSEENGRDTLYGQVDHLDVLVNNIGYYENVDFFYISDTQWERMIELNFMIGMRLSRHYLAKMLVRGFGRIIFVSSESALNPDTEKIHYCVSKTMVSSLARNLAELTYGSNVTVNALLPGPVLTEGTLRFITERYSSDAAVAERMFMASRPTSIINRLIRPEEIGHAALFLADRNGGAINGANIKVDGGIVRSVF